MFKSAKNDGKPVYMVFPGSESIQFDLEKLFLLAVSKADLHLRRRIRKNVPYNFLVTVDLESGFGSFPAGSREDFSSRIRICGKKTFILVSGGLDIGFLNLQH